MGSRVLIEILILLTPFAIYGLYRIALTEAAADGKKPWPVQRLFIIGFVLAVVSWLGLLVWDKSNSGDGMCPGQPKFVDGELVETPDVPCPRDVKDVGIPASDNPGGAAAEPSEPETSEGEGDG